MRVESRCRQRYKRIVCLDVIKKITATGWGMRCGKKMVTNPSILRLMKSKAITETAEMIMAC